MAYEIPQELEYRERILFGLTLPQVGYAAAAVVPSMFILRSAMPLPLKLLSIMPMAAGALWFTSFNGLEHTKNYVSWSQFRYAFTPSRVERYTGFSNNQIGGLRVAALEVVPTNFIIRHKVDQESIIASFRKVLNGLEIPLQILTTSEQVTLDDYAGRFKESKLTKDHVSFLRSFVKDKGFRNRRFYVVIKECPGYDFDQQLSILKSQLGRLQLKIRDVDQKTLQNIIFNNFSLKSEKYHLIQEVDYIKINGEFSRVVYAHGYPRSVDAGFLDRIVSRAGDFDVSIHVAPQSIEDTMVGLNRTLQKQRADLYAEKLKGRYSPSLEIQHGDTKRTLERLQKGEEKLFKVSLYVRCRAHSLAELERLTRLVESELNAMLVIPRRARYRHLDGLVSVAPLATDRLLATRHITSDALSAFFPFTSPYLEVDPDGVWMGVNRNDIPVIKDIFSLSNPNGVILSQSGGGKSYFAKLLIARYRLHGVKVLVIDPQGEYSDLTKRFGGQVINLSRGSKTTINPLDLMGQSYPDKRLALMSIMPVLLGDVTEPQRHFLDRALTIAYEGKGFMDDISSWGNAPPLLEDVLRALEHLEHKATSLEKSSVHSLINRLSIYVTGVFSFLNKPTKLDIKGEFVCFDINDIPKAIKPALMFLVLEYVHATMRSSKEKKILLIDEAWSLLRHAQDSSYIFEMVKTSRKFNMGMLLINQEVEGLLTSEAGKSVLANSSYTLLLRQKPSVMDQVQQAFHLSQAERNFLLSAAVGEGLLLIDDEHLELKVVASRDEHKLITTNPNEGGTNMEVEKPVEQAAEIVGVQGAPSAKPIEQPNVVVNVYDDRRCFRRADLSEAEVAYRLKNGYSVSEQVGLDGKRDIYLIKPRFNEGPEHMFLIYAIRDYLVSKGAKAWLFETNKPDIIFENSGGKKFAIEVETGVLLERDPKKVGAKVASLKREFGLNWFFVVTKKDALWKYKRLGPVYTRVEVEEALSSLIHSYPSNGVKSLKTAENSLLTGSALPSK